jgi:hypothetical protein
MLSGEKSYPFLSLIDEELARLLPNNQRIIVRGAGHQMWLQEPDQCRSAVEEFLRRNEGAMQIRKSAHSGCSTVHQPYVPAMGQASSHRWCLLIRARQLLRQHGQELFESS